MVTRWQSYVDSRVFELSVPLDTQLGSTNQMADFWTEPWPYWYMKEKAPVLFKSLEGSGLVVFKVCNQRELSIALTCKNFFYSGWPQVSFFRSELFKYLLHIHRSPFSYRKYVQSPTFSDCVMDSLFRLTGDVKWPVSTPFETAIGMSVAISEFVEWSARWHTKGPLAGSFPLLSLRTIKADIVVGVEQSVADRLDECGEKWRISGRYALVSFLPRRAISS